MDRGGTMIKITIDRCDCRNMVATAFKKELRGKGRVTSPYHFYVDCNATITRLKDISTLDKDDELRIMVDCGKTRGMTGSQKSKIHGLLATVKARFKGNIQNYENLLL